MPPRCFSFTATRDRCYRHSFSTAGLHSTTVTLDSASTSCTTTTIHLWVPRSPSPTKRSLLLLHGFGANATWQWDSHLRPIALSGFNVYIPDLVFFGESHTTSPDRSESFQAECVVRALSLLGVERVSVVGISYGGFVAFRVAAMFPDRVEKVVLCCAGVCLEEKDLAEGLFVVDDVRKAAEILLPRTPQKLRELMGLSFVKPMRGVPSCFLSDYIDVHCFEGEEMRAVVISQVMCTEYVEEKTQLLHALVKDRKLSDLPKITQPTLILWGEQDKIFPLELGHRLNRHLEDNSQLVVIKNAGHAVNLEKPKEFRKYLKAFLLDSPADFANNHKSIMTSTSPSKFEKRLRSLCSNQQRFLQFLRFQYPSKKDVSVTLLEP